MQINLLNLEQIDWQPNLSIEDKKLQMNRPFHSCVLSYLAMNASEAGGDIPGLNLDTEMSRIFCSFLQLYTSYLLLIFILA